MAPRKAFGALIRDEWYFTQEIWPSALIQLCVSRIRSCAARSWGCRGRRTARHLVGGLGGKCPKVPLHVVVAQVVIGAPLLGPDEVLEFHRVTHEEDRGVVADDVQVALAGVEPQHEPARSRQVSGLPRSPATVENRISVSVLAPG
jgi:hypothetical protein